MLINDQPVSLAINASRDAIVTLAITAFTKSAENGEMRKVTVSFPKKVDPDLLDADLSVSDLYDARVALGMAGNVRNRISRELEAKVAVSCKNDSSGFSWEVKEVH